MNENSMSLTEQSVTSKEQPKRLTKKEVAAIEFARVEKIEQATVDLPAFKSRGTFIIGDYTKFKIIDSNREVTPNPKLKEDLQKFGQLDPITVKKDSEGKYVVLNGQHRLYHLKELGLPVECIELKEGFEGTDFDVIKSLNVKGRGWNKENYSSHYIKGKNTNYSEFRRLNANLPNLSESIVFKFVNGRTGKLKLDYENGTLIFQPTESQEDKLTVLNELIGVIGSARKEHNTKSYFDKPQIVDLLNTFIEETVDFDYNTLKKSLREEGDSLSKESTIEHLDKLYQKFKLN